MAASELLSFAPFRPLFKRGLGAFGGWLFWNGPLALRLGALVSLSILICSFIWLRIGTTELNEVFVDTLSSEVEQMPQPNKGLEAFVLSGLGQTIDEALQGASISPQFQSAISDLQLNLDGQSQKGPASSDLHVYGKGNSLSTRYLSDSESSSFLFVPAMAVRMPPDREARLQTLSNKAIDKEIIDSALKDPQINRDIKASVAVGRELQRLEDIPVFRFGTEPADQLPIVPRPVQSYFVTRSGVIRIHENNYDNQKEYYERQFDPTTFFPSRPYFWPATLVLSIPKEQLTCPVRLLDYFHNTRPYVDLGGNGVVVTLCTHVRYKHEAVLCFDFSLGPRIRQRIKEKIERFGGFAAVGRCNVLNYQVRCEDLSEERRNLLENAIYTVNSPRAQVSEMFGKVRVLYHDRSKGLVKFSVPVGVPSTYGSAGRSAELLYGEIDLAKLRAKNTLKMLLIVNSFIATISFLGLLIADFGKKYEEQEKAFDRVREMMESAPVAYSRLDEKDRFVDVNDALIHLFGFDSVAEGRKSLVGQRFADWLADDVSQNLYADITEKRKKGQGIGPYVVKLWRAGRKESQSVKVYAAPVPGPRSSPKDAPQTFGILELCPIER
jgi:PAS domain-containing protein